jgi:alkylation response protein AidB-like acyl-CoA dehydrogenase
MIVDLLPSEDQQMIADSINAFLSDRLPVARLREETAFGGAAERGEWQGLAELGLFGLGVAEDLGGLGLGVAEEALVARSLGAHLLSPSVLAQLVAPHLAVDADTRAALIAGKSRAAFASAGGHLLDGADAGQVVFLTGDGVALVAAAELSADAPVAGLDETVTLARVAAGAVRGLDDARVSLLIAAYLTGIAQAATDMAVEYAKTREQFGQPIGAFQAIKHMCADMATRAAAADAQVFYAAVTFDAVNDPAGEVAAGRILSADAAIANGKANIQIHGGMGFTAECDAHLLLKRAQLMAHLGATAGRLRGLLLAG